ncbi:MAG: hypothetical protein KatS3mg054_0334 [Chloroflexus sp.]|nr:MAG: hypothetical protein KatS3mg054_0334 [Chloroflexus sp.]
MYTHRNQGSVKRINGIFPGKKALTFSSPVMFSVQSPTFFVLFLSCRILSLHLVVHHSFPYRISRHSFVSFSFAFALNASPRFFFSFCLTFSLHGVSSFTTLRPCFFSPPLSSSCFRYTLSTSSLVFSSCILPFTTAPLMSSCSTPPAPLCTLSLSSFFPLSLIIPHTYSFISSLPLFLRSLFHSYITHHTLAPLSYSLTFFLINTRRPIIGINTHPPIIGRHFVRYLIRQFMLIRC